MVRGGGERPILVVIAWHELPGRAPCEISSRAASENRSGDRRMLHGPAM
jgi:hypothetical protein